MRRVALVLQRLAGYNTVHVAQSDSAVPFQDLSVEAIWTVATHSGRNLRVGVNQGCYMIWQVAELSVGLGSRKPLGYLYVDLLQC